MVAHLIGIQAFPKGTWVFESPHFRHGSVGHVASPLPSKGSNVKAFGCSTHPATAKFWKCWAWASPLALKANNVASTRV
jgi:hypothetical protein